MCAAASFLVQLTKSGLFSANLVTYLRQGKIVLFCELYLNTLLKNLRQFRMLFNSFSKWELNTSVIKQDLISMYFVSRVKENEFLLLVKILS